MKMRVVYTLLAAILPLIPVATANVAGSIQIQKPQGNGKRDLLSGPGTRNLNGRATHPPQTFFACGVKNITFAGCDTDADCKIPSTKRCNIGPVGIEALDVLYALGNGFCDEHSCDGGVFPASPMLDMCKEVTNYYFPNAQVVSGCHLHDVPTHLSRDFICTDSDGRCQAGVHREPCVTMTVGGRDSACTLGTPDNPFLCPGTQLPLSTKAVCPPS